jgi:phage-related protein
LYKIEFYEDREGKCDVKTFIFDLKQKRATSKDARINFNKVVAYIDLLEKVGTSVGLPVVRHLEGEIWELRPLRNRIMFAYCDENTFVLLHHFKKATQKTPRVEIDKAKKELEDYMRRRG